MKMKMRRVLAMLMMVMMLVSMIPTNAFAAEGSNAVKLTAPLAKVVTDPQSLTPYITHATNALDSSQIAAGWDVSLKVSFTMPSGAFVNTSTGKVYKVWQFTAAELGLESAVNSSGILYDNKKNAQADFTVQNGVVTVTFYDDFLETASAPGGGANGNIVIGGRWDIDNNITEDVVVKEIGNDSMVIYPFGLGDIKVEKSVAEKGEYDRETGLIKYKIVVSSTQGTHGEYKDSKGNVLGGIKLVDTLPQTDRTQLESVTINGTPMTNPSTTIYLPNLKHGESHEIIVTMKVTDKVVGGFENKAKGYTKNGQGVEIKSESKITAQTFYPTIAKKVEEYNNSTGEITWKITVNTEKYDLTGLKLEDKLSSGTVLDLANARITKTNSKNGAITTEGISITNGVITFTKVNGQPNTNTYYIYVKSPATYSNSGNQLYYDKNFANLYDGDDIIHQKDAENKVEVSNWPWMNKSLSYDSANRIITYSLKLNPHGKGNVQGMTISDSWENGELAKKGLEFVKGSGTVSVNNGKPTKLSGDTLDAFIDNANSKIREYDNNPVAGRNMNIFEFTYQVYVPLSVTSVPQNTGYVWKQDAKIDSDYEGGPGVGTDFVSKEKAFDSTTGHFKWTITINPTKFEMDDSWVLTDVLSAGALAANRDITIIEDPREGDDETTTKTGNAWGITTFEKLLKHINDNLLTNGGTSKWTIIYYTTLPANATYQDTVTNTVSLKGDTDTKTQTVAIDGGTSKSFSKAVKVEGGYEITWNLQLKVPMYQLGGRAEIVDTLSGNHYVTQSMLNNTTFPELDALGVKYTFTPLTQNNGKITKFKITLDKLPCDPDHYVNLSYKTFSETEDYYGVMKNTAATTFYGDEGSYTWTSEAPHEVIPNAPVTKSAVASALNAEGKFEDELLRWDIHFSVVAGLGGNNMYLKDTLPTGIELTNVSCYKNGTALGGWSASEIGSGVTPSGTGKLTYSSKTLQWDCGKASSHEAGAVFRMIVTAKATSDFFGSDVSVTEKSLTNKATLTVKGVTTENTDTHVVVRDAQMADPVTKSHVTGNNTVTYTVDINPDALKLQEGTTTTLNVEDTLTWNYQETALKNYPRAIKIDRQSVTLKKADGTDVPSTLWTVGFVETDGQCKMTLTVPDGEHLKLSYRYTIDAGVLGKYDASKLLIKFTNTVKVKGYSFRSETGDDGEITYMDYSYGSVTTQGVTVNKTEDQNQSVPVPGAFFKLYKHNGSAWEEVASGTSNDKGVVEFTFKEGKAYETKVPYKLQEEGVPFGYTGVGTYHFSIDGEPASKPSGYNGTVYSTGDELFIKNTPTKISLKVDKIWHAAPNAQLPESINVSVYLKGSTTPIDTQTIKPKNGVWSCTFENLRQYENGEALEYVVKEEKIPGWGVVYGDVAVDKDGNMSTTITNTSLINIEGTKTWNDNYDQDGIRPTEITVNLLANGKKVASQKVTSANGWKWSFTDKPEYDADGKITYTVSEEAVEGYTPSEGTGAYDLVNTHTPEETQISVTKRWVDANNQDGLRPASIQVQLYANGEAYGDVVELKATDNWTHTWTELPKKAGGTVINYTVDETAVPEGYTKGEPKGTAATGFTITNTHTPATIEIPVLKTWEDLWGNKCPESVTVNLYDDADPKHENPVQTLTLTDAGNWTGKFTNLPKYRNNKGTIEEIQYTVVEVVPDGFELKASGFNKDGVYILNNCLTTIDIEVDKKWIETNAGTAHNEITVYLLNDGKKIMKDGQVRPETIGKLNAGNKWHYEFTDLPEYIGGKPAAYSVEEVTVEGYASNVTGTAADGFIITNTELTEASVIKSWVDNSNQDGVRPATLTVNLLADSNPTGKSVILSEDNSWTGKISGLLKYRIEDGQKKEIVYTWQEVPAENSPYEQTGNALVTGTTVTILTNKYVPAETEATIKKVWDDAGNQDGVRPATLTVNLLADGKPTGKSVTLPHGGKWEAKITDLPKYRDGGTEIVYTWQEELDEATAKIYKLTKTDKQGTVTTLTNSHTPETVEVKGEKSWVDKGNEGKRPGMIIINLLADGQKVDSQEVTSANGWKWSFTDLPKYKVGKVGQPVTYTITEDPIYVDPNAEVKENLYDAKVDGYNVINTISQKFISLEGHKTWTDGGNAAGKRPGKITINLLRNGAEIAEAEASEANGWSWKFEKLAVYGVNVADKGNYEYTETDGRTFVYTVTEDPVDDYTTKQDGNNFTNTIAQETVDISGVKKWNKNGYDRAFTVPAITIELLRDGTEVIASYPLSKQTIAADEAEKVLTYEFTDLPKYAVADPELATDGTYPYYPEDPSKLDGHIFDYTVREVIADAYDDTFTASAGENADRDFINTLVTTSVEGIKTWKYVGETMTVFPDITIELYAEYADGEKVLFDTQVLDGGTLNAEGDTDYAFTNLPVCDENGDPITYTVQEVVPTGYSLTAETDNQTNGKDFVNTLVTVNVSGKKIWDGNNNTITKVPTIKVELLRDGEVIDTAILKNGTTTYAFNNLPKHAVPCDALAAYTKEFDGHAFVYTVREVIVVDNAAKAFESGSVRPTTAISGSFTEDFTNKVVTTEVEGTKAWNDMGNEVTHPDVVIELYRDEETAPIATRTLKHGDTEYSFADLPKYAVANFADANGYIGYTGAIDGHEFVYSVKEVIPHGYTSVQTGTAFANTLETVEVKGEKTWIDAGNEKLRPESITIELYRDNKLYKTTEIDVKGGESTYSFTYLPKYAIAGLKGEDKLDGDKLDGHVFSYTVKEVLPETYVPAYTPAMAEVASEDENIHIYNFTNTLKTIVIGGVKTWLHSGEAIDTYYPSITIVLKQDGEEYDRVVLAAGTADAAGETAYAFENLPEINGLTGEAHVYTVEEIIPEPYRDGYVSKTTGDMVDGYEITNNLVTVNVSGKKNWDGNNNTITKVPTIKVELLRDGEVIDTAILENGTTTYAFNNLPKHAVPCDALAAYTKEFDGHIFTYTVREVIEKAHEAGYVPSSVRPTTAISGSFTEDFTNKVVTTEVEGTKAWNDMGNEMTHPDVVIELYRDEETAPIATRTLKHGDTEYSFADLPKYAVANFADANGYIGYTGAIDGHEFVYSVKEVVPHGYTSVQTGTAFANTLETVDVEGTKTWIDLGNEDQRPETITINLMRDGKEYDEAVIAINATDASYSYSFTNLPKFAIAGLADAKEDDVLDGHEFVYTVTEDAVADYDTAINGYDVTNTISQKFTELEGKKTWIDGNDEAGKRPESIIIRLWRDGEQIDVATVTAADDWAWKFEELAVYGVNVADKGNYTYDDADGHTFVYTVTEDEVPEYSTIQNVNDFTNTIIQDYTDVVGEKTWIDYNNEDGKRPAGITVNLLRDGVEIDEVTVGEDEGWAWEFKDLPMYAVEPIDGKTVVYPYDARDGHTFKYTVTEDEVEDYTTEIEGFDVINTLAQEYVEVEGAKTWVDPTGTLHAPITINLLRDGMEVDEIVLENGELEYVFDYLPKYAVPCDELADYTGAMDGHIFTYTVTEDLVPGYTTVQIDTNFINTIEQDWIPVTVNKIWVDNGAVDVEHPAITVHLLRNGTEVASAVLENGVTSHTFTNLMRYNLRTGQPYVYTVTEDPVEGYTTAIDGLTITNTSEGPEMITISGTKTWSGDNGIEHNNAEEVKITLTRRIPGGKVEVVNAPIKWDGATYRFDNLLRADENGNNYIYSIREDLVEGYATYYAGYDIVNRKTYDVVPVEVSGTKHWVDNDNERGTRPEQITVHLLRDGVVVDKAVINAGGDWNYKFTNLPDNDGFGHYYTYTITEQLVPGYWMMKDGTDLYNTSETPPPPPFPRMRIEELEELLDIFDYGVPLWGGLLGTGDEVPVYPFAFGGVGLLALVAYLLFNRKRNRT